MAAKIGSTCSELCIIPLKKRIYLFLGNQYKENMPRKVFEEALSKGWVRGEV
jgi:hypothetical protein